MLPQAAILPLILFMALSLVLALHGLAAAGHFPHQHRSDAFRSWSGSLVLFGSIAFALAALAGGLVATWQKIPWYAATIGGGATVLAAPLVLQLLPDRFVDGRGALVVFAGASLLLALALMGS